MGLSSSRSRDEGGDAAEENSNEGGSALSQGYEELVNLIIRPPRMSYSPESDLGPSSFSHCGKRFCREDLEVVNGRGHKLACSWWKFEPEEAPAEQLPCVIYLHGNASCRIAAFELLRHLLPLGITVFAMDFAGSGLSGGEYVSLGYFEREDVEAAIAHLRGSGQVSTVGLWGHSMGAATALLYGDRDPSIAGMVLDSAFADLMQLVREFGQNFKEQGIRVPGFCVPSFCITAAMPVAANMIRHSVRRRAKFEPRDVSPISKCNACFIPALFAHGEGDNFIRPSHSEQLHDAYAGDKNLVLFDGDHNSQRPDFFFSSAVIFLRQTLGVKEEHCLDASSPNHGLSLDRGFFSGGAAAVRQAEEEMMRQAMMLSIADAANRRTAGSAEANGRAANGTGAASPSPSPAASPAPPPAPARAPVPAEALQQGMVAFRAVADVGGACAQYYVEAALSSGGTVEDAIQRYFDSDCAEPPAGWQPPAPQLLAL